MGNGFIKDCLSIDDCNNKIDEECVDMANNFIMQSGLDLKIEESVRVIISLSWIVSTMLAIAIYYFKELHVHPLQLYQITCVL